MKYPFRVKVFFDKKGKTSKIATIMKLNQFLNHEAIGEYEKYNMTVKEDLDHFTATTFAGIELAFANHVDAVHFKLGFITDGEEIRSDSFRETQKSV